MTNERTMWLVLLAGAGVIILTSLLGCGGWMLSYGYPYSIGLYSPLFYVFSGLLIAGAVALLFRLSNSRGPKSLEAIQG